MSRVFQRPDRGGYYLGVPVPYELRKKLKKIDYSGLQATFSNELYIDGGVVRKKQNKN